MLERFRFSRCGRLRAPLGRNVPFDGHTKPELALVTTTAHETDHRLEVQDWESLGLVVRRRALEKVAEDFAMRAWQDEATRDRVIEEGMTEERH